VLSTRIPRSNGRTDEHRAPVPGALQYTPRKGWPMATISMNNAIGSPITICGESPGIGNQEFGKRSRARTIASAPRQE